MGVMVEKVVPAVVVGRVAPVPTQVATLKGTAATAATVVMAAMEAVAAVGRVVHQSASG